MPSPEHLVQSRHASHGKWSDRAALAHDLKEVMRAHPGWAGLQATQREALDAIAVKMSRILAGNPAEVDHWDDIAGYAYLGSGRSDD